MTGIIWPFSDDEIYFLFEAGLSARQADLDNVIKPLLDTFQEIFSEFNDNKVYHLAAKKVMVPKTEEYLFIELGPLGEYLKALDIAESEDLPREDQEEGQEDGQTL